MTTITPNRTCTRIPATTGIARLNRATIRAAFRLSLRTFLRETLARTILATVWAVVDIIQITTAISFARQDLVVFAFFLVCLTNGCRRATIIFFAGVVFAAEVARITVIIAIASCIADEETCSSRITNHVTGVTLNGIVTATTIIVIIAIATASVE